MNGSGSDPLRDRGRPGAACTRTVYDGADIDEFRARYGKAEGERLFFELHRPAAADAQQDAPPPEPEGPRFVFDEEIGPFDSVYIDAAPWCW